MFETNKPVPTPNQAQSPLKNPANWTKPKVWIVPIRMTVMVDDPTKYDFEMKKILDKIMNELRSITRHFDKSGKQLIIDFGDPIKDPDKWDVLSSGEASSQSLQDQIRQTIEQMNKDKEKEKK